VNQNEDTFSILEENNGAQFKIIIIKLLYALCLLAKAGIVHCDLKAENVLIEINHQNRCVSSVKVIDFGTSLLFSDLNRKVDITTPEYLPPEILEYIEMK
jgi:serine/threonine protein kinase